MDKLRVIGEAEQRRKSLGKPIKIGCPSLSRQVWQAWTQNQDVKLDQNVEQGLDQPTPQAELASSIMEPTGPSAVIYIDEWRESGKYKLEIFKLSTFFFWHFLFFF